MATHRMTANAESLAIKKPAWGRKMQPRPMRKRRTNYEKDYRVAQESACSRGLHARWRGGRSPGGSERAGIDWAEYDQRRDHSEVVQGVGKERLGTSG